MPHVAAIALHPVKSTAIRTVEAASVERAGLRGDRRWMVVDGAGDMVSARELPGLFRIVADIPETGAPTSAETDPATGAPMSAEPGPALRLRHPEAEPLAVELPGPGTERPVSLFGRTRLTARPAGREADAWLRRVLGRGDLALVWCDDPGRRALNPEVGRPGDHAAFQDGYPVTVLSTASVARVGEWIAAGAEQRGEPAPEPLSWRRFRPNLLVEEVAGAFAEDEWERVRIGQVVLRRAKQVARCVMTTIDPDDLGRGKDPIRALARHRSWDGKTWCAVHLVPEATGVVRVGDEVTPL